MKFGEDNPDHKWIVGLSNGSGNVRFVRVPNRSARTLTAIVLNYVEAGSVVRTDGWRGYADLERWISAQHCRA